VLKVVAPDADWAHENVAPKLDAGMNTRSQQPPEPPPPPPGLLPVLALEPLPPLPPAPVPVTHTPEKPTGGAALVYVTLCSLNGWNVIATVVADNPPSPPKAAGAEYLSNPLPDNAPAPLIAALRRYR
jgi:hypothetical protein